jgi:hypothetical protein
VVLADSWESVGILFPTGLVQLAENWEAVGMKVQLAEVVAVSGE